MAFTTTIARPVLVFKFPLCYCLALLIVVVSNSAINVIATAAAAVPMVSLCLSVRNATKRSTKTQNTRTNSPPCCMYSSGPFCQSTSLLLLRCCCCVCFYFVFFLCRSPPCAQERTCRKLFVFAFGLKKLRFIIVKASFCFSIFLLFNFENTVLLGDKFSSD